MFTSFEDALRESEVQLAESSMTSSQRKAVASMRSSGWRIVDRGDEVVLTNGADTVSVDASGTLFYLNESYSTLTMLDEAIDAHYFSSIIPILEENEQDEEKKQQARTVVDKLRVLFNNLTVVTLTRGRETYIVTTSKDRSEFVKMDNDTVTSSGNLFNRRTANNLVDRLKASGFEERNWQSVVPKRAMQGYRLIIKSAPIIAILFAIHVFTFGVSTMIVGVVIRALWSVLVLILSSLPLPSIQLFTDAVDSALEAVNSGFRGDTPVVDMSGVDAFLDGRER